MRKRKGFCPYVSRGGLKLEHALKVFKIEVKGKVAIDVGAGTGGFTDCLLQHGAAQVYAIDVGYGQLAWKLRKDLRVIPVERTNVRYLKSEELYEREKEKAELATVDVSFISLSKVLPAIYSLLTDKGEVIALVKPQFEAKRALVEPGGLITKPSVHEKVLREVIETSKDLGFRILGLTYSPIRGADGNIEFFIYLSKHKHSKKVDIKKIVKKAHKLIRVI